MKDEIICRCNEVYRSEIEEVIDNGSSNMNEIKRFTRAGMGLCQGRTCRRLIENIMKDKLGIPSEDIEHSTYRQPVRTVRSDMFDMKEGDVDE